MRIPETQVGDPETFAIIGAAMEVHRILGCGFLEAAYAAALVIEMRLRGMPVEREVSYTIRYKGQDLLTRYRADLVCFGKVIVEVKATRAIGEVEMAQAMNYMRASGLNRALILNFSGRKLAYKRVVMGYEDVPSA
jgi:GxxExxY protein